MEISTLDGAVQSDCLLSDMVHGAVQSDCLLSDMVHVRDFAVFMLEELGSS